MSVLKGKGNSRAVTAKVPNPAALQLLR